MIDASALQLPAWARVSEKRRGHIARVTTLLDTWSCELGLSLSECAAWHDAGQWHDALRDASESELRATSGDHEHPVTMLHGPAAAIRLAGDGESRVDVLEAIRWHTLGAADWSRTGRALYMADFLEPGRPFSNADRAFLAAHVPDDFDGVFRQVVRARIEWTVREGKLLYPETAALWNDVR